MSEGNVAIAFQNDTLSVSWISSSRTNPGTQSKRNHIPCSLEICSLVIYERKCVCISGMILFVVPYPAVPHQAVLSHRTVFIQQINREVHCTLQCQDEMFWPGTRADQHDNWRDYLPHKKEEYRLSVSVFRLMITQFGGDLKVNNVRVWQH